MRFEVTLRGGTESNDGRQNTFFLSPDEFWIGLELLAGPRLER